MKAYPTYLLDSLSNNDVTFFIPPYQRNYEWAVENCKVFFADAQKVARDNRVGIETEHFFGSIVYMVEEAGFGVPSKYVLTDGQQRITTTMLFLMGLRDTIEDPVYKREIQRRFLENDRADETVEYKIKLKQVESDWDAYKLLVLGQEVVGNLRHSAVYQNYLYFCKVFESMDDPQKRDLLEKGLKKFSIISIELEPTKNRWENPQEIFESMNSLGKPLSLADLVRNYLLMGKSANKQSDLYSQHWLPLEKRLPGKLSEFIRDWMQSDQHKSLKVARESNYKELYGSFKEIVRGRDVEEVLQSFVKFARPYSIICGLESSDSRDLDQTIFDLNVIGIAPAQSYLTEFFAAHLAGRLSQAETLAVLRSMRTYLLRRRVLGLTSGENKFYPVLGKRLVDLLDSSDMEQTIFSQLSSQEYALRLPNDDEMSSRLRTLNFYNLGRSRNYPRLILSMAEECFSKARPDLGDNRLQLEHIMPQTLSPHWVEMLGEDAELKHQDLLNNIGNITLIRHNQELGNRSFSEKKATYAGKSGLQIAQNYVLDCETWSETSILRRQDYLISLIITELLAIPPGFQHASNWSQHDRENDSFDSREILNRLIGETIEFVSDPRITAQVISDSRVLFEEREWALSPLTRLLKERSGARISRTSNFHGASNWTWDGTKLVDVDI